MEKIYKFVGKLEIWIFSQYGLTLLSARALRPGLTLYDANGAYCSKLEIPYAIHQLWANDIGPAAGKYTDLLSPVPATLRRRPWLEHLKILPAPAGATYFFPSNNQSPREKHNLDRNKLTASQTKTQLRPAYTWSQTQRQPAVQLGPDLPNQ